MQFRLVYEPYLNINLPSADSTAITTVYTRYLEHLAPWDSKHCDLKVQCLKKLVLP